MLNSIENGEIRSILVALNASPGSKVALRAAVETAALLEVELEALFVEDSDLSRLAALPVCRTIGAHSAAVRPLDQVSIAQELRALTTMIEQDVAYTAGRRNVSWSFRTARGNVVRELLLASRRSSLFIMGCHGRSWKNILESTTGKILKKACSPIIIFRSESPTTPIKVTGKVDPAVWKDKPAATLFATTPFYALYTGSAASKRAVALAARFARCRDEPIILLVGEGREPLIQEELVLLSQQLGVLLQTRQPGPLPQQSILFAPMERADLLEIHTHTSIALVP